MSGNTLAAKRRVFVARIVAGNAYLKGHGREIFDCSARTLRVTALTWDLSYLEDVDRQVAWSLSRVLLSKMDS